jgi:hypothetical protein
MFFYLLEYLMPINNVTKCLCSSSYQLLTNNLSLRTSSFSIENMFLYKMTNVNSDHRGYSFTISKMRNYCKIGSYYFGPELLDTSSDAENSFFLSCCRYLLILFRDAPVEVWAMTKHPVMVSELKPQNIYFFYLS